MFYTVVGFGLLIVINAQENNTSIVDLTNKAWLNLWTAQFFVIVTCIYRGYMPKNIEYKA